MSQTKKVLVLGATGAIVQSGPNPAADARMDAYLAAHPELLK